MSTPELQSGQRISEYVLEERLGRGGFGEVWSARHHAFADRRVAIKVPGSAERAALLKREGALQDRVRHPHAVEVLGMDADHDPPYLVMELVEGESLRRRLEREKRLAPAAAVEFVVQVLAALEHAHARGVVHRDVKPENILLGKDGRVKLTDFGLGRILEEERARLALSGSLHTTDGQDLSGTIAYMAPEQREPGRATDARVDLYATGIVLFEMLAGVRPEGGEAPSDLVAGLDPRIDHVFRRCYCRVDRRYPSAAAIIADLAPLAGARALAAAGPLPPGAGPTAHLVPLRPETGSPERILLDKEPRTLENAAQLRYERGSFWVTAREGGKPVHVVPGSVPDGRRPDEFDERVGTAPLRLAEGMIIRIGDPAEPARIAAYGFHDGPPADFELMLVDGAGNRRLRPAPRRWPHIVAGAIGAFAILFSIIGLGVILPAAAHGRRAAAPLAALGTLGFLGLLAVRASRKNLALEEACDTALAQVLTTAPEAPPVDPVARTARAGAPAMDGVWGPWAEAARASAPAQRTPLPGEPRVIVTVSPVSPPHRANDAEAAAELAWAANPPAGFWIRAAALAMDIAVFAFVAELLGPRTPIAIFVYDWLCTATFGATIGKYVCGVRIQRSDGEPIGLGRALLRTSSKVVSLLPLFLGFALASVTPGKQALHDFFSGTRAVRVGGEL